MSYKNVYVGRIAIGANDAQALKVLQEAEAHNGPSLIIAYCPCINHGFDLNNQLAHQKMAPFVLIEPAEICIRIVVLKDLTVSVAFGCHDGGAYLAQTYSVTPAGSM